MLSAKKFAQRAQVSYTTVMAWLRAELIPGARFVEESPHGAYWEIPASSLEKVEKQKRGPKPKQPEEAGEQASAEKDAPHEGKAADAKPIKKSRKKGEQ